MAERWGELPVRVSQTNVRALHVGLDIAAADDIAVAEVLQVVSLRGSGELVQVKGLVDFREVVVEPLPQGR